MRTIQELLEYLRYAACAKDVRDDDEGIHLIEEVEFNLEQLKQ